MTFRIGAEYQLQPNLTLLAGVRYDETPIRDEYINPEFIDASRLGVSAGPCYQLTRRLNLEGAYSFEYGQQRTARTNRAGGQHQRQLPPPGGPDGLAGRGHGFLSCVCLVPGS